MALKRMRLAMPRGSSPGAKTDNVAAACTVDARMICSLGKVTWLDSCDDCGHSQMVTTDLHGTPVQDRKRRSSSSLHPIPPTGQATGCPSPGRARLWCGNTTTTRQSICGSGKRLGRASDWSRRTAKRPCADSQRSLGQLHRRHGPTPAMSCSRQKADYCTSLRFAR